MAKPIRGSTLCLIALAVAGCSGVALGGASKGSGGAPPHSPAAVASDPVLWPVQRVVLEPVPPVVVAECKAAQARARFPILCPTRLPRPVFGFPGRVPPPYRPDPIRDGRANIGLDIGFGAPWETPGDRRHLWRDRPCCFLHFVIQRPDQGVPKAARPASLGGIEGRLLPAGRGIDGAYWGNHVRFFFSRYGIRYAATLHSFGNAATEQLLGRIIRTLRPARDLHEQPLRLGGRNALATPVAASGLTALAADRAGIWAITDSLGSVYAAPSYIDSGVLRFSSSGKLVQHVGHFETRDGIAIGFGSVWIAGSIANRGVIFRIDEKSGKVVARIPAGTWPRSIAVDRHGVWVVDSAPFFRAGSLRQINPRTNRVVGRSLPLGPAPAGTTAAYSSLWILDASAHLLTRVDPTTRSIAAEIPAGRSPYALADAAGSLWVTDTASGNVTRIDPRTNRRTRTFHVGGYPYGITGDAKAIWVARLGGHPAACIDIATGRIRSLKGATTDSIDLTLRQHTLWAITSGAILRLPAVCGRDSWRRSESFVQCLPSPSISPGSVLEMVCQLSRVRRGLAFSAWPGT